MDTAEKIALFEEKSAKVLAGGGEKAIAKQHRLGKQTARERIDMLLDEGTFREIDRFVTHRCTEFGMEKKEIPADGVVTGYGKIDGRTVFLFAQDFTAQGGSLGEMHAAKICKAMDMAREAGAPFIGLNDSGGARIQESVNALSGYGKILYRNSLCSGHIPQISVMMGPCAGGAVYSPAITDFVLMVECTSQMFITGPAVIEAVIGEEVAAEELGGSETHTMISGVAHLSSPTEEETLEHVRRILSYLPSSAKEKPPVAEYKGGEERRPKLDTIIPDSSRIPYDMVDAIEEIVDEGTFFQLQPLFADNIITGFGRIGGRCVGIVANQPYVMGGCLDVNASDKAARFIQCCDAFNVPLVNLVDVPGFLPGIEQEHTGIIRHGAKMIYTYSVAEVPKITVIFRKAYGGSSLAMCSKDLGADMVLAWPTAEIAVMGASGAANILFRKEVKDAEDPEQALKEKTQAYSDRFVSPFVAAERGFIDAVIRPSETRARVLEALELLEKKERKGRIRGNMPL